MKQIPNSLRIWFIIHFVLDIVFAIPLLFFTEQFLQYLHFSTDNLIFARLVGAALIGIGGVSFVMHKEEAEVYRVMLILKLLWSGSAIFTIGISLIQGAPQVTWIFLVTFAVFFIVWSYYYRKIK
ncbi:MAG: hypothetical protein Q8O46_00090 [bacterium]|nr:hypothetical protein [bacterium]